MGLTGPQTVLIPLIAVVGWMFVRQARRGPYAMPAPPTGRPVQTLGEQLEGGA